MFRLPNMLWWKFAKFLISFLKAQVIFPSNFASIFSAIKHNSSILFLAQKLYNLVKSSPLKCKFLRFSIARVKTCQLLHVNFVLVCQFLFKVCIIHHCHDITSVWFLSSYIFNFRQKYGIKVSISRLPSALVKICQIPHVNFWKQAGFLSNFVPIFSAVKHNSSVLF